MPYSKDNPPQWSKNKSEAVQKVAYETFNSTYASTKDEDKARIASLAAMSKAEQAFKDRAAGKSTVHKAVEAILKSKYS